MAVASLPNTNKSNCFAISLRTTLIQALYLPRLDFTTLVFFFYLHDFKTYGLNHKEIGENEELESDARVMRPRLEYVSNWHCGNMIRTTLVKFHFLNLSNPIQPLRNALEDFKVYSDDFRMGTLTVVCFKIHTH
jgi:hypothetical protein